MILPGDKEKVPPVGEGVSEYVHCMIHAGRKRRMYGLGSCVGGPIPVFVLYSVFCSALRPL